MPRAGKTARPQPHTFPEQKRQTNRRRYRVLSKHPVGEVKKGGIVELALTSAQEAALIESGAVSPVSEMPADAVTVKSTPVESDTQKNRPSKADTSKE